MGNLKMRFFNKNSNATPHVHHPYLLLNRHILNVNYEFNTSHNQCNETTANQNLQYCKVVWWLESDKNKNFNFTQDLPRKHHQRFQYRDRHVVSQSVRTLLKAKIFIFEIFKSICEPVPFVFFHHFSFKALSAPLSWSFKICALKCFRYGESVKF